MKKEIALYLVLSFFVTGCSSDKESQEELPFIDVSKEYPEKKLI